MKKWAGKVGFVVVTLFLVLVTACFCVGTVMSRTDLNMQELESYYSELERELVKEARGFLREEGFANSGVMLTRVIDADGSRQYTLTVHHGKIDKMGEEDRQLLMEKLEGFVFVDENSTFFHEFLVNR